MSVSIREFGGVFEDSSLFFHSIKSRDYPPLKILSWALLFCMISSFLALVNNYLFTQSKFKFLSALPEFFGLESPHLDPDYFISFALGSIWQWIILLILSLLVFLFSRIAKTKLSYSKILPLTVSLYLIPLAFLGSSVLVNLSSYLLIQDVSSINTLFFPYFGIIAYFSLYLRGIKELGETTWKRSLAILSPFLILLAVGLILGYLLNFHLMWLMCKLSG